MTGVRGDRPDSPHAAGMLAELSEAELVEERDFLLGSLTDLDAELAAGDIDQHDYIVLKDGYTARAAATLRAIDALRGLPAEPDAWTTGADAGIGAGRARDARARDARAGDARAGDARRRPRWRTPVVVVAVVAFAVGAGLLVATASGQRVPGAAVTGAVTPAGPQGALQQASADLNNGKYLDAVKLYDDVIRQDPRNAEALAYRGWILALTGKAASDTSLIDRGLASVRAAEAADPGYPDAHFFAGEILLRDKSDPKGAVDEFRQCLASHPPAAIVPEVQGELNSALAMAGPSTAPPTSTAP